MGEIMFKDNKLFKEDIKKSESGTAIKNMKQYFKKSIENIRS